MSRSPGLPLPAPSPLARHWSLNPAVCFLNHGSFGACPNAVLEAQQQLRARMEAEPVRFFVEDFEPLMDEARQALAAFVRCDWRALAPMPNATTAVATIVENLVETGRLAPGDEILTDDHEYPACQNNLRRAAARAGAKIVCAPIPFPCPSPQEAAQAYLCRASSRTRLALISHITSPTGLVLPVAQIVEELEAAGVMTLVDGAHAPGMIPDLDIDALRPSFYTANCHKWLCTPKGSAFLYVRPDLIDNDHPFRPLVLSNNAERPKPGRAQFLTEFDYAGTSDYTAFLTIPAALRIMTDIVPAGWPALMRANHELCIQGRDTICRELGVTPPAPDSMIGSISTIVLPPHNDAALAARLRARPSRYHDALQDALLSRWSIQVPIWGLAERQDRFVRIAAQCYNSPAQYEYLAAALREELSRERSA
jgi:isopenicillin-N epimerase